MLESKLKLLGVTDRTRQLPGLECIWHLIRMKHACDGCHASGPPLDKEDRVGPQKATFGKAKVGCVDRLQRRNQKLSFDRRDCQLLHPRNVSIGLKPERSTQ